MRHTLAFKLVATGAAFLAVALTSIALTLWVTWKLEGGAAAVNEAGRLRMMTYRLALDAASGRTDALPHQAASMDATLALLRAGDPSRPLFVPWSEDARRSFDVVERDWRGARGRWLTGVSLPSAGEVGAHVAGIDAFVAAIEAQLSHWTDVLRAVQFAMMALAVAGAVLMLYTTHLMVLDPLRRLAQGMAALRAGEFRTRVEVASGDEFGELSAGFNAMAVRLQALYNDLEDKVREKTARLEVKRARLAALYEVSAFVAQADALDELARGFAAKIRAIAGADAVAIRWSNENNDRHFMLAHDRLPARIVDAEQCLPAGACHCAMSGLEPGARVIPLVPAPNGLGHCAREGFTSLVSVPVMLHHRRLGEIDLFYRGHSELDADERSLMETLASHLAGGIESLRVIAAGREAAASAERALIAQELHDSIAQSLAFLKIQVALLREALRRGDPNGAERTLAEIDAGVRESYSDVRELLVHFRTRTSAEDIEPALRTTLAKFQHQTGLPVSLSIEGHGIALPPDVQVQVLHVVQEALSNVRKHANASSVNVRVRQSPEWQFEVDDDGCGFEPNERHGEASVGLRIMRERAARIGARVDVRSWRGGGTRVVLSLPRTVPAREATADADSLAGR